MNSNDNDDDDDNCDGDDDNNKNNFNEAFFYQLIVYPRYSAMQSESVLSTAAFRLLLLSPKVQFNWCIRQQFSKDLSQTAVLCCLVVHLPLVV